MKTFWPPMNADKRGLKNRMPIGVNQRLSAAEIGFSSKVAI
jgi:hypothetical protein